MVQKGYRGGTVGVQGRVQEGKEVVQEGYSTGGVQEGYRGGTEGVQRVQRR